MKWHVGTSGWSYDPWEGPFYPKGLPSGERLAFYASHFDTVEINNSFYHLPTQQRMLNWESRVPDGFMFAVKGTRYITHIKKLKEPAKSVPPLLEVLSVQQKGGPVIFQLPPRFPKDLRRLEQFLHVLPATRRFAIEFRDTDWHDEEVYALLARHNVAFCLFEKGRLHSPKRVTADFVYLRLHGREEGYYGNYDTQALREWHDWLAAQERDAYVYFDNTADKTVAIENAKEFRQMGESSQSAAW